MRIFSINQVNQVYVAKAYKSIGEGEAVNTKLTTAGDVTVRATKGGFYVNQMGPGGLVRSDIVPTDCVLYTDVTEAKDMAYKLKTATVTLDSAVNEGNPIAGQDYILRIEFDGYIGISPEDSKYWKYATVHATANMTPDTFYKTLALSLVKGMSREATTLIKVYLTTSGSDIEVSARDKVETISGTATGIKIVEVEQDWLLGTKQQQRLKFDVVPTTVEWNSDEYTWGTVTYGDGATIGNGKIMAEFEYFHHGARGDQYRLVGFPDYIPTTYLVDPSQTYDLISIHYAYVGPNEGAQKSEKDLNIICLPSATEALMTALNAVLPEDKALAVRE